MFETSITAVITADVKHPTHLTEEERKHLGLPESK